MSNKSDVIKQCSNWYKTLSGQSALANTEELCAKTMSEIFGYYAIQIGALSGEYDLLKHSRINASFSLANPDCFIGLKESLGLSKNSEQNDNDVNPSDYAVISSNEQLPISTDNVDLVIASHVLEMSLNPHQVLREIDRVLVPEGHCILIGFNPYALSNFKNPFNRLKKSNSDDFKMRSIPRVKDWFSLLGFEVLEVNYMGLRPKVKNKKIFNSLNWLENWSEYAGPLLGSMYVVHAKKHVIAMRPDKKVWRAPALLEGGKVALNRTAQKIRRDNFSNL